MNPFLPRLAFLLAALSPAVAPAVEPSPAAARSGQIRRQIDALLQLRRQPAPLPADPPNPFVPVAPGGATASPAENAAPAPEAQPPPDRASHAELLARHAARLRIGGLIRLKDQVQIVINDSPWKEGDYLILERSPHLIQVQVARISTGQLTLRLEDAELTVRF